MSDDIEAFAEIGVVEDLPVLVRFRPGEEGFVLSYPGFPVYGHFHDTDSAIEFVKNLVNINHQYQEAYRKNPDLDLVGYRPYLDLLNKHGVIPIQCDNPESLEDHLE